jgi:hydroxymethylglutaryl-CoA lyase
MTSRFPTEVRIREVGPREGLQTSQLPLAAHDLLTLINLIVETGVPEIEVASMIRLDKVPSMQIAEQICSGVTPSVRTRFSALYLNQKGLERALQFPALQNGGWVQTAVSDTFLAKNANSSFDKSLASIPSMVSVFEQSGLTLEGVMLSCTFGCSYEGKIPLHVITEKVSRLLATFSSLNQTLPLLVLADTAGLANPQQVTEVITAVRSLAPTTRLGLHLHDTRGLGIANAYAGLVAGIDYFDASIGGIGGCPFMKGATGNIATEELVYLCHQLGIQTGILLDKYLDAARYAATLFGDQISSRLLKIPAQQLVP